MEQGLVEIWRELRLHSLNCWLEEVERNKAIVDTGSDGCTYDRSFKGGESVSGLLLFEKISSATSEQSIYGYSLSSHGRYS